MNTRTILSLSAAVGLALSLSACANMPGVNPTGSVSDKIIEFNADAAKAKTVGASRDANGIVWGMSATPAAMANDAAWISEAVKQALQDNSPSAPPYGWNNTSTGHKGSIKVLSRGMDAGGDTCKQLRATSDVGVGQLVAADITACLRSIAGRDLTWSVASAQRVDANTPVHSLPGAASATAASNDAMPRTSSAANVRAAQQYTAGTSSADYSHVAQNVHTALTSANLRAWPWNEPSTGHSGSVEATRQYSANGLLQRDIVSKTYMGKKLIQTDRATYSMTGQDTWTRQ